MGVVKDFNDLAGKTKTFRCKEMICECTKLCYVSDVCWTSCIYESIGLMSLLLFAVFITYMSIRFWNKNGCCLNVSTYIYEDQCT